MIRRSIPAIAVAAVLALAGCGDDDKPETSAAGDVPRYCALVVQLEKDGEKYFAGLERRNATEAEFEAAERRFVEDHTDELGELREAAPASLKADVDKLLAGMRERAGLKPAIQVSEREASAAEERIQAFERRECR